MIMEKHCLRRASWINRQDLHRVELNTCQIHFISWSVAKLLQDPTLPFDVTHCILFSPEKWNVFLNISHHVDDFQLRGGKMNKGPTKAHILGGST